MCHFLLLRKFKLYVTLKNATSIVNVFHNVYVKNLFVEKKNKKPTLKKIIKQGLLEYLVPRTSFSPTVI